MSNDYWGNPNQPNPNGAAGDPGANGGYPVYGQQPYGQPESQNPAPGSFEPTQTPAEPTASQPNFSTPSTPSTPAAPQEPANNSFYGQADQPSQPAADPFGLPSQPNNNPYGQPSQPTPSYPQQDSFGAQQPAAGYATPSANAGNFSYQQGSFNQYSMVGPMGQGASPYASWGRRAIGALVDYILPGIIAAIIGSILGNLINKSLGDLVQSVLILAFTIYNTIYLGGTTGQSIGRQIAKIRLVSMATGQPIGPVMALVRCIAHFVDAIICYVGFLFPLWDQNRQTLADKIMKTVVVDESNGQPPNIPSDLFSQFTNPGQPGQPPQQPGQGSYGM